jgi:hypothetical protein
MVYDENEAEVECEESESDDEDDQAGVADSYNYILARG